LSVTPLAALLHLFLATLLTGTTNATSTIFRLRIFRVFLCQSSLSSLNNFETPPFYLTFVDSGK
jgi:hypothetical protein